MKKLKTKNAFTMIELIFVIIILSILAVVAIPKLTATRADAINTTFRANVATCISDIASNYTARDENITAILIDSFDSCSKANGHIASSVEANTTSSITVSNTGTKLDGIHTFSGTCIICVGQ